MEDPDYDIVPHNEIFKLKQEVDELKNATSSDIQKAMHELTDSINNMNDILKEASKGMKTEENEALVLTKKFDSLIDVIKITIDENKKIAEAMISLSKLIKDILSLHRANKNSEMPPQMMPPQPQATQFRAQMAGSAHNIPPPRSVPGIQTPIAPPIPRENTQPRPPPPLEQGSKTGLFRRMRK